MCVCCVILQSFVNVALKRKRELKLELFSLGIINARSLFSDLTVPYTHLTNGHTIQNETHLIKIVHLIVRFFNSVSFQIKMFFIILITIILSKHKYTKKCCLLNRRLGTIMVLFFSSDLVFTLRVMKPAQCSGH